MFGETKRKKKNDDPTFGPVGDLFQYILGQQKSAELAGKKIIRDIKKAQEGVKADWGLKAIHCRVVIGQSPFL